MILSNVAILEALATGRLKIEPRPEPERPNEDSDRDGHCPYQTSSVDLRLGDEVSFFRTGLPISIDLSRPECKFADLFGSNSQTLRLTKQQPFAITPGQLVLARTLERVSLPIISDGRSCLAARVEGKSSYARCGLLVHFTAPTIHAGFSGTITLELINLGPLPVLLYPETPICQLILEEVCGVPFRNDSQFQNQQRASGQSS